MTLSMLGYRALPSQLPQVQTPQDHSLSWWSLSEHETAFLPDCVCISC